MGCSLRSRDESENSCWEKVDREGIGLRSCLESQAHVEGTQLRVRGAGLDPALWRVESFGRTILGDFRRWSVRPRRLLSTSACSRSSWNTAGRELIALNQGSLTLWLAPSLRTQGSQIGTLLSPPAV